MNPFDKLNETLHDKGFHAVCFSMALMPEKYVEYQLDESFHEAMREHNKNGNKRYTVNLSDGDMEFLHKALMFYHKALFDLHKRKQMEKLLKTLGETL